MSDTLFAVLDEQAPLDFTERLADKYQPRRIADFIGLEQPKAALAALVRKPRPCGLILVGDPGTGKSTMAQAFASELKAGLIHVPSATLTVEAVADIWEKVHYYPESGGLWVVVCEEADRMSRQAQVALLSKLDSAAKLKPRFGGGYEAGTAPPVIWIFTCNGTGLYGTDLPDAFEKRFVDRCLTLEFKPAPDAALFDLCRAVWDAECDWTEDDPAYHLEQIVRKAKGSVRAALQALELSVLTHAVAIAPAMEAWALNAARSREAAPKLGRELGLPRPDGLPLWDLRPCPGWNC